MDENGPPSEDDEPPDALDPFDPREAARVRRRDHDLGAESRGLMRPGMGKVFKQITDSWGEKADAVRDRARKGDGKGSSRPQ